MWEQVIGKEALAKYVYRNRAADMDSITSSARNKDCR